MPKTYTYQGQKFDAEALTGLLGEEFLDEPKATADEMVKTRDVGSRRILTAYRKAKGL